MEENQQGQETANTTVSIVKRVYNSAKQPTIMRPFINQHDSLSVSTTEMNTRKGFKSIILHKRAPSNNPMLGMDNIDNTSTDNQDENSFGISKSINKRLGCSFILKDFNLVRQFFSFQVEFRLLFRASDHHFSVQKFHELCDYQTNTMTLCKTKYNQIIGGYTPLTWAEDYNENKTFFKTDKTNETFIFSVTKKEKYPLAKSKKNKAICCFRNWGPTFGGGYDFQIGNNSDTLYSSTSYFPRSFTCNTKHVNQKYFTGSKNKQFKIIEWEVYKVIKKRDFKETQQKKNEEKEQSSFFQTIKNNFVDLFFTQKK